MFLLVFCSCLFRVYFLVLFLLLLVFGVLFFGYSKSYFSVNSNKDNITDTVVYVSFFIFFYFFCQTIKLQNIAKVCCVYTSTY